MAATPIYQPELSAREIVATAANADPRPGAASTNANPRPPADEKALAPELALIARLMDNAFEIPGLRIRFGFDALVGLIPGLGDVATSLVSLYLLSAARRYGASRATLARMGLNIAIDALVGAVPLVGDMFDVYWKANVKNVQLLERHISATPEKERALRRGDRLFVAALILSLAVFATAMIWVTWSAVAWLGGLLLNAK